jgi:hypothetical protein
MTALTKLYPLILLCYRVAFSPLLHITLYVLRIMRHPLSYKIPFSPLRSILYAIRNTQYVHPLSYKINLPPLLCYKLTSSPLAIVQKSFFPALCITHYPLSYKITFSPLCSIFSLQLPTPNPEVSPECIL